MIKKEATKGGKKEIVFIYIVLCCCDPPHPVGCTAPPPAILEEMECAQFLLRPLKKKRKTPFGGVTQEGKK